MNTEQVPFDLLSDDYDPEECSDNSIDEEELNNFLMGDVLAGTEERSKKSKKLSYADRFKQRLLNKKRKKEKLAKGDTQVKKKKKRKSTVSQSSKLKPELEKLMQEATNYYLDKKFDEAVKLLKEIVRRAPGLHDPFHTLGLIYEEEYKDLVTATSYYLLAAHLVPTDIYLWHRIGEMSQNIGNIDQAIYCFKKCLKDAYGEINEEVYFSLAICYVEKKDYNNAIKKFSVLFQLHPEDILVTTELSKCFQAIGDLNSSLVVLTAYFKLTFDMKIVDTICDLQISLELYTDCYELLEFIAKTNNLQPKNLSSDNLVYYVIASLHLDKEVKDELSILWDEKISARYIYAISVALSSNNAEEALKWFKKGFQETSELSPEIAIKIAKLIIQVESNSEFAITVLKRSLETHPDHSELLIALADALADVGDVTQVEEVLSRLTVDDFDKLRDIPPPIDQDERKETLFSLYESVGDLLHRVLSKPASRAYPCLLSQDEPIGMELKTQANRWVDNFIRIIKDCEMDTKRAMHKLNDVRLVKQTAQTKEDPVVNDASIFVTSESGRKGNSKNYSFLKIKRELGLQSAEDILGWDRYEDLIGSSCIMMSILRRFHECFEILELISNGKKRYKSSIDHAERKRLIRTIDDLSFKMSSFGGLFKIAIGYARNEFLKDPTDGNLQCYSRILGTGKLAHAALFPLSSSNEKDILLENRAWITRQLLQKPNNFELLMLAGHFCTISGNWTYAIDEYTRAVLQRPNDSVAALCLAVSYFNSATRKFTVDMNKAIVLGMTFLQRYSTLRKTSGERLSQNCQAVFMAESCYNIARAFHMVNMPHLAVLLYETCIKTIEDVDSKSSVDIKIQCPCIICDYCRKKNPGLPHSVTGFSTDSFIWNHGKRQIVKVSICTLITPLYSVLLTTSF